MTAVQVPRRLFNKGGDKSATSSPSRTLASYPGRSFNPATTTVSHVPASAIANEDQQATTLWRAGGRRATINKRRVTMGNQGKKGGQGRATHVV